MAHLLISTYDLDETLATIEHTRALYDVAPIAIGDAYSEGDNLVVRVDSNDDTIALLADVFDIDIDDDDPFVTDDVDDALTDGHAPAAARYARQARERGYASSDVDATVRNPFKA